ncbi:DUF362 domain-containing protein [Synechococcus sp. PCC 7335]|uniref:DUF362 domain-containing protein n=1 Tax=Synechococcus sp. (strain ATCC 29403 / PCC 7335) TaxID=91464 RepID=UPI0002D99CB5|nr:DUF362 domain-containing protein [Synechococcus sp. PCC 7335]
MKAIAQSHPLQNTAQAITQTAATANFIYSPPPNAKAAKRILVKPNLGYPVGPPVTVSMTVLRKVIAGLRSANPTAEILIVEGVCSKVSLADIAVKNGLSPMLTEGVRLLNADELECIEYPNRLPEPIRFKTMWAPKLLQEVDCRISVSAFKKTSLKGRDLISASLKNLYGLFPREKYRARSPHSRGQLHRPSVPLVLQDVYFSVGHLFDGGVVDCDRKFISHDYRPDKGDSFEIGQVIWGNDLLAVDQLACKVGSEKEAAYLAPIVELREADIAAMR